MAAAPSGEAPTGPKMHHKTSQALYAYWNEIRGMRVAPRRFEIEPARIAAMLPDTFILECDTPGDFRFRLAGTRMAALLGRDLRDSDFLELFVPQDRTSLRHVLAQAVGQAPVTVLKAAPDKSASPVIEALLLPLFHTQTTVTRLLGCAVRLDTGQHTRHAAPPVLTLLGQETIWPDGRPRSVLEQLDRQSPFSPMMQTGRVFQADRRRFRVFDGGRST